MRSIAVFIVRLVIGGLLAGHGAQKLFGWFGGSGFRGTAGWMESMRLRPGGAWARIAGGSELAGGVLTMLGFLNPLGPVALIGSMAMAWAKVHLGKPVWVTAGGAELPLTNLAVLAGLTIAGPGRVSLDGLFGIRVPRWVGATALAGVFAALWVGAGEELKERVAKLPGELEEAVSETVRATGTTGTAAQDGAPDATDGLVTATINSAVDAALVGDGTTLVSDEGPEFWGVSGAEAGTAMGAGSALGSETPDEA